MCIALFIKRNPTFIVALLCLLSRLPQLVSPDLYCDGDECVVALMAEKMYEGKEISFYFWGQRYGFTLFECLSILPYYCVFGYKIIAVKLGILSLWTTGTVLLFKTVLRLINNRLFPALLLITGFILFPAWMVQSMKAWGGAVTAYVLSNLILYLLFCKAYYHKWWFHVLLGFLCCLLFESQRLWLVGVLPLWVYMLYIHKQLNRIALTGLIGFVTVALLWSYKQSIPESYRLPIDIPDMDMLQHRLRCFPFYLYRSLHDNYFFSTYQEPNFFNAVTATIGCIFFWGILVYTILYATTRREDKWMVLASGAFVPAVILYSAFTRFPEGRYLLPVSGYITIALAIVFSKLKPSKVYMTAIYTYLLMACISTVCYFSFADVSANHRADVYAMINYLNKKQIKYVYSEDCMLPYELMFYSDNRIFARMPYQPARYQPASDSVDNALKQQHNVAVVRHNSERESLQNKGTKKFNDFCVSENMPQPVIAKVFEVK